MKKVLIILTVVIALFTAAFLFSLKSRLFLALIENYAGSRMNRIVHIGSMHLDKDGRIVVRDVTVIEEKEGGEGISLPETVITLSTAGIIKRTIDGLIINEPEIRLRIGRNKTGTNTRGKLSLPVRLKKAIVRDAGISVDLEEDRSFQLRDLNIDLDTKGKDGQAEIRAAFIVPGAVSKASLNALADMNTFELSEVHIDISGADVGALSGAFLFQSDTDTLLTGSAEIKIDALRGDGKKVDWRTRISVRDFSASSSSLDVKPDEGPLTLISAGSYSLNSGDADIRLCELRLPELATLQMKGGINDIFSNDPVLALDITSNFMPLHRLKRIVSGTSVTGLEEIDFQAATKVNLSATGRLEAPQIRADVYIKGDHLKASGVSLDSFNADIPVTYKDNAFSADDMNLNAARATLYGSKGKIISDTDISLRGAAVWKTEPANIELKNITVNTSSVKDIAGDVTFTLDKGPAVYSSISWKDPDIQGTALRLFPSVFKDKGFNIHGTAAVQAELRMTSGEQGEYTVSGTARLDFSDAGFSSSDETKIGDGIQAEASGGFELHVPFEGVDFNVDARASGFELLAGKFYGDFKDKVLSFSGKGRYAGPDDRIIISDSSVSLSGIGNINFTGDLSGPWDSPMIDGVLHLVNISNRGAFDFFVRETFREQAPIISEMEIDGDSTADLFIKGSPREFAVHGQVGVRDMNVIAGENGRAVKGINIDIPLGLSYPGPAKAVRGQKFGSVRIGSLEWGILNLADLEIHPAVRNNTLTFRNDITIKFFGGEIVLKDIKYSNMLRPERILRLAISVNDINLADAGDALGIPRFSGSLSGTIPSAVFSENRLETEGEVVLKLFDGFMRISDLSIDNVFSPVASITSSIEFEDINLGELTGTFDFGNVSGILDGRIEDLVIVNGQAQGFKAHVETVKKKGIDQRISVEALKKISILGTGSSTSILDLGIYRFLRKYRYEKMGFTASLKNDNLLLLGIDSTDGVGYLVKGGLIPPKVNVINYNQNVSFKEMVSRLKRIKRAER